MALAKAFECSASGVLNAATDDNHHVGALNV